MANVQEILDRPAPTSIWAAPWPEREDYTPSPAQWRDQNLYFLLPDRFSDGNETDANLLDRDRPWTARPAPWRWDAWFESGKFHFQGGTIKGITSKLPYLSRLGVTALWVGPVWKQRGDATEPGEPRLGDPYYGYAIQNFLDVDPRFGTRADLEEMVRMAHRNGILVIADIVINHCAVTWVYNLGTPDAPDYVVRPPYTTGRYDFGTWLDATGGLLPAGVQPAHLDEGVWPEELCHPEAFTRAGGRSFGEGDALDPGAEHKRSEYMARDLALDGWTAGHRVLDTMIRIWSYAIALYDLDGFRVDTLKHVAPNEARLFCGAVREFADGIGKSNFLILGEVGGGDAVQETYLSVIGRNLTAVLETGQTRRLLNQVAMGRPLDGAGDPVVELFSRFDRAAQPEGITHRSLGTAYGATFDDHDKIFNVPLRQGVAEFDPGRVTVSAAMLLFMLGIPCLYYGAEQALVGPEPEERQWLPAFGGGPYADTHLRQNMFACSHPRRAGLAGRPSAADPFDPAMPGFGPFGTSGKHVFDEHSLPYRRTKHLLHVRAGHPVLKAGRQYLRTLRSGGGDFAFPRIGQVLAWSRILAQTEALCVVNPSLEETREAHVQVCGFINDEQTRFTVVANTAQIGAAVKQHELGSTLPTHEAPNGFRYVELGHLPPASALVLINKPFSGQLPGQPDG